VPLAERGQEMVRAVSGAGLVKQPRKGDGQIHAGTMRPRWRPVTMASLPNWARPQECAFIWRVQNVLLSGTSKEASDD
jgi:hypothetical protein